MIEHNNRITQAFGDQDVNGTGELQLSMKVTDAETILALQQCKSEEEQQRFALSALKFGARMLREAVGAIDQDTVRQEGEKILDSLETILSTRSNEMMINVSSELTRYFDPETGKLEQRLEKLIAGDGELDTLLTRHLDKEKSFIDDVMEKHVGENSELLRMLSPDQKNGLLDLIKSTVNGSLESQSAEILQQFSLDDEESAISRMVKNITDSNGTLRAELATDVSRLTEEFSLDNEESALSAIVKQLKITEGTIENRLTLDNEDSPLSLLKREVLDVLENENMKNQDFRAQILAQVQSKNARDEESSHGTRQGLAFEHEVNDFLEQKAQQYEDLFNATGTTKGRKGDRKLGDAVIELGEDSRAAGARIVIEAKKNKTFKLQAARNEIEQARKNRSAQAGIFVYSRDSAPKSLEPLKRYGSDIIVIWDPQDENTDPYLDAALTIARSIVIAGRNGAEESELDLTAIENAIQKIMENAEKIQDITQAAGNVVRHGNNILDSAEEIQNAMKEQVKELRNELEPLRDAEDQES